MYEELINKLCKMRDVSTGLSALLPKSGGDVVANLYGEAADAIEELQAGEKKLLRNISALEMENENLKRARRWIPVTERLPSDFVSVQAHMTDAGNFPPVREAYVINKNWFFPALKEFLPVDMWKRFDEPPKEE